MSEGLEIFTSFLMLIATLMLLLYGAAQRKVRAKILKDIQDERQKLERLKNKLKTR